MSEPLDYQAFNIDDWIITPEDQSFLDFNTGFDPIPPPVEGGMDLGGEPNMPMDSLGDSLNFGLVSMRPLCYIKNSRSYYASARQCATCGDVFADISDWGLERQLFYHGKEEGHPVFSCSVLDCDKLFMDNKERDAHQKRPHVSGHGRSLTSTLFDCIQCGLSLSSKADLLRHAKEQQHQPYACDCGVSFSRLDVLNRHLDKFSNEDPKYPCVYCKLHRGPDGFKRHDHLLQHMRNYHHHNIEVTNVLKFSFPVCIHPGCPQYRNESFKTMSRQQQDDNKPFPSRSAYTKHMRDVHNECPFPCDVLGCSRVGRKGYFREKDLMKHRRDEHPGEDEYQVTPRDTRTCCLACGASLDFSSWADHLNNYCPNRFQA